MGTDGRTERRRSERVVACWVGGWGNTSIHERANGSVRAGSDADAGADAGAGLHSRKMRACQRICRFDLRRVSAVEYRRKPARLCAVAGRARARNRGRGGDKEHVCAPASVSDGESRTLAFKCPMARLRACLLFMRVICARSTANQNVCIYPSSKEWAQGFERDG